MSKHNKITTPKPNKMAQNRPVDKIAHLHTSLDETSIYQYLVDVAWNECPEVWGVTVDLKTERALLRDAELTPLKLRDETVHTTTSTERNATYVSYTRSREENVRPSLW